MIVLVIALGFAVLAGLCWWIGDTRHSDTPTFLAGLFAIFALATIIMFVIVFPVEYYGNRAAIEAFHATQETLQIARMNDSISEYELAALQTKVVEINQWLGRAQYQARLWAIRLFWPREVLDLKPLQ